MNRTRLIYFSLFFLSASVLCFEIVSTRITSVIFVNNYAYIILSLAILGLGSGGVFSYYRMKAVETPSKKIFQLMVMLGASFFIFILTVIKFSMTDPYPYFFLLFLPFFIAGILYAQVYKMYSEQSFKLYACDLSGAAFGSVGALGLLTVLGAPNSILFLALLVCGVSVSFLHSQVKTTYLYAVGSMLLLCMGFLIINGKKNIAGEVPIGFFPEKDFYYVYPDPAIRYRMLENRWSIYGRSDLVQYSHQDVVRQLFIDGSAGTQVYRFNGNILHSNSGIQELLLQHTNAIPFLCLQANEKRSMLVIGPGGGKEILLGLFGDAGKITGVEVNSDFVNIVKDYKEFDGGIYSDFPNVNIVVEEGRHYVKQSKEPFDLIVMALPSTEQMQNIELFAMSENYLLTEEALRDYFNILTPDGRMIFTVHNRWELMRLLTTTTSVLTKSGIALGEVQNHFAVIEAEYAPTIVIKKNAFTKEETLRWKNTSASLPKNIPQVTYLPYGMMGGNQSAVHNFLANICQSDVTLQTYIAHHETDISPCRDDKPYFYNMHKGAPGEYLWLLAGIACFNFLVVWLPFRWTKKIKKQPPANTLGLPLVIFSCIGVGSMILELSLFQKLVLYLGSPTISLSILLSSMLVGMGTGSYFGKNIFSTDVIKRLSVTSISVVLAGILLFMVSPVILSKCLEYGMVLRSTICFLMILPLAFFLGISFPSCIQLLRSTNQEKYIPWMYGVNGVMSVLGSVLAIIVSMYWGFTPTYGIGLSFYLCIFLMIFILSKSKTLLHYK